METCGVVHPGLFHGQVQPRCFRVPHVGGLHLAVSGLLLVGWAADPTPTTGDRVRAALGVRA